MPPPPPSLSLMTPECQWTLPEKPLGRCMQLYHSKYFDRILNTEKCILNPTELDMDEVGQILRHY